MNERATMAAKRVLCHYFQVAFASGNISWTSDNQSEVEGIVDDIVAAAKDESNAR